LRTVQIFFFRYKSLSQSGEKLSFIWSKMSVENVKSQVLSFKSYAFGFQNIIFWVVKPMLLQAKKHDFRAFLRGYKESKG